ncbi:MAG: hypothetical protein MKZ55_01610 [Candidatus Thalassarchaeum sp.]|nr:hypothetical protein [Candidatus Thalassarchaeum sp.]
MQTTAPWSSDEKKPPPQVVVGSTIPQQQVLTGQVGQQVIYVPNPEFKPETNLRHISYIVMAIGIGVYVLFGFFLFEEELACGLCCFIWAIGLMLDAAYYSSRATWQSEQGQSTTNSTLGLVGNVIIGFVCLAIAFLFLLPVQPF